MEYKPFYQRLKVLFKGDYPDSDIAFRLIDSSDKKLNCKLTSGKIFSNNYELPLVYTSRSRLLIPFERKLYDDKALLEIVTEGECELSISLQLKRPKLNYRSDDIQTQLTQLYQFMGDLAGMSKFMLPELKGATVTFADAEGKLALLDEQREVNQQLAADNDGKLQISIAEIGTVTELRFNQQPQVISLWLANE
jgi:hypothetical protein